MVCSHDREFVIWSVVALSNMCWYRIPNMMVLNTDPEIHCIEEQYTNQTILFRTRAHTPIAEPIHEFVKKVESMRLTTIHMFYINLLQSKSWGQPQRCHAIEKHCFNSFAFNFISKSMQTLIVLQYLVQYIFADDLFINFTEGIVKRRTGIQVYNHLIVIEINFN